MDLNIFRTEAFRVLERFYAFSAYPLIKRTLQRRAQRRPEDVTTKGYKTVKRIFSISKNKPIFLQLLCIVP